MTTARTTPAIVALLAFIALVGCGSTDLSTALSDRPAGSPAFAPVAPGPGAQALLRADGFELRLNRSGRITLVIAEDEYAVESRFSAPGDAIEFNPLPIEESVEGHGAWRPAVMQISPTEAVVTAACPAYRFKRRLMLIARLSGSAINLDREIPRD